MEFMHEGGLAMYPVLAVAVAAGAGAVARRRGDGWRLALFGAVACLALGMAGVSGGVYNTVAAAGRAAEFGTDAVTLLSIGLRESVNNTLFAGLCAFALAAIGVAVAPRGAAAA